MKDKTIKAVLSALTDDINADNAALYQNLSKGRTSSVDSPEDFYFNYIYPHQQYLRGLIQVECSNNENVAFIMLHSDFIEHQFEKLFEKLEGSACCADKSRTIMKGLLDFYKDGKRVDFNYDQKYTYHLPKTIFKTHEIIIEFFQGVQSLYYGHSEKYLKALLKVKEGAQD